METKKTTPILPGVIYTQLKDTHTFKEITETEELEKAFRLRYKVYSKCSNRGFLKENKYEIDIDAFDLHSRHYGLYVENNKLAGYFRVVLDRNEYFNNQVFEVGQNFYQFNEFKPKYDCFKKRKTADFPFLSYPNVPDSINSFYNSIKSKNEDLAECSRLILIDEHRGLRTAAFLIECAIILYIHLCLDKRHAILSCDKEHCAFYKRYGFQEIVNDECYNIFESTKTSKTLFLSLSKSLSSSPIPARFHSKFQDLADEFSKTGKISRAL